MKQAGAPIRGRTRGDMLTQLRIQNFKAWQDTDGIRLAPLTVFFGTNSSGKTSLLQFLLMLKQTVQSTDRRRVLNFGDNRSLVELGVWPDMVFRHEPNRKIHFTLEWRGVENLDAFGRIPKEEKEELLSFEAEVGTSGDKQSPLEVKYFSYHLRPRSKYSLAMNVHLIGNGKYKVRLFSSQDERSRPSFDVPAPPVHFHALPFERLVGSRLSPDSADALHFFQYSLEQELDSIRYLGPLRMEPYRLYAWAGDLPEDVGIDGEDTVKALLASQERQYTRSGSKDKVAFAVLIAQWLQYMGILESFELRSIAPHRKEYEVFVRAAGMKDAVNLTDVGFGVSQILPVLVQLLYVERRSTLIFEQPELHLHPRAQSELADVFIDALGMQEEGRQRKIQLLVESHSEHFLRRLQRRVAEEKLAPEQVALYFCKPSIEGSIIEELKLDEYGNISNWPENFFGDEVGDLAAMTEAAMKRQLGPEEG